MRLLGEDSEDNDAARLLRVSADDDNDDEDDDDSEFLDETDAKSWVPSTENGLELKQKCQHP